MNGFDELKERVEREAKEKREEIRIAELTPAERLEEGWRNGVEPGCEACEGETARRVFCGIERGRHLFGGTLTNEVVFLPLMRVDKDTIRWLWWPSFEIWDMKDASTEEGEGTRMIFFLQELGGLKKANPYGYRWDRESKRVWIPTADTEGLTKEEKSFFERLQKRKKPCLSKEYAVWKLANLAHIYTVDDIVMEDFSHARDELLVEMRRRVRAYPKEYEECFYCVKKLCDLLLEDTEGAISEFLL